MKTVQFFLDIVCKIFFLDFHRLNFDDFKNGPLTTGKCMFCSIAKTNVVYLMPLRTTIFKMSNLPNLITTLEIFSNALTPQRRK